ncbi:MAG: protein translocase subunit SecD [Gemmatimonadetes bacterium]|nr:protein translocase subunit SecD [Gemmatimonadota bacterium]
MFNNLKARFALIAALALLSGWFLYQNYEHRNSIVTLGLDLQGGTHLALEIADPEGVMPAEARADATDRALTVIRTRIDELGVAEPVIQKVGDDRIVVELPGAQDEGRAKEILQRTAFLQFQIVRPLSELEGVLPRMDRAVVDAVGVEAAPADPAAVTPGVGVGGIFQPRDTAAGDTAAVAAGTDEAAPDAAVAARPLSARLMPMGGEGQLAVAEEDIPAVQRYLALPQVQRLLPRGSVLRWGHVPQPQAGQPAPTFRTLYLLEARPIITGEFLQDAQAQREPQFNQPIVTFEFSRRGGRIFERATGENIGNQMAIMLDDRVFSAPVIRSQIGARGQIELGGGSIEEARDLALVLRAGALPAPLRIIEERTVGPSLGQDSIDRGRIAGLIGISLVILTMLGYYRVAGAMAVAALGLYMLFVLGGLAMIGATLTLPGIAGLVLSIGMAVDANVLIFERIREELAAGRGPRMAVNEGFGHALSAIVDSNLTTLITAAILFQFGTGPIRGFAVTLGVGIIASMFTAIFITRTFFMLYLERRGAVQTVSI